MVAAFFTPILMDDSISCKLFRFSQVTSLLGAPTSWDEQAIYWASKGSSSYALKFAPFFWLLYFIGWIRALLDGDYCRRFSLLHRCLLLEHVASGWGWEKPSQGGSRPQNMKHYSKHETFGLHFTSTTVLVIKERLIVYVKIEAPNSLFQISIHDTKKVDMYFQNWFLFSSSLWHCFYMIYFKLCYANIPHILVRHILFNLELPKWKFVLLHVIWLIWVLCRNNSIFISWHSFIISTLISHPFF